MVKISFRSKILLLLIFCMCMVQLATMFFTLLTTERAVKESVAEDLNVAESIFDELFDKRFLQLSSSVEVLSKDFGFRRSVASRDIPTIESALRNHGARAKASIAVFIDLQGNISSNSDAASGWETDTDWLKLIAHIQKHDYVFNVVSIQNSHYQAVSVPVNAPDKIGWLLMGFIINEELAKNFKNITNLDISIHNPHGGHHKDIISTLAERQKADLMNQFISDPGSNDKIIEIKLNDQNYLTKIKSLGETDNQVYAILQKSLLKEMAPYFELKSHLIHVFGIALLIAILFGMYTGGNTVKPILKLANDARRIGEGNYSIEIETNRSDEIGQLGETLNIMQHEISEREKRIYHQTHYDELTGLPNRYLAKDRIQNAINRAKRDNDSFTVVMMDLARFKQINDSLGHNLGDVVLKETAQRLNKRLRKSDTAARLGGDDFLLILEHTNLETCCRIIKEEIDEYITQPITLDGMQITYQFNYGIIEYPTHADDAEDLLRRCEIALYEAKDNHEHYHVYEIDSDKDHIRQLTIVSDIDQAIKEDQLTIHYQPKVCYKTGGINQAEALIRWIHPTFGFMPPDEFITVLERTGNINKLSQWLIEKTCKQCASWLQEDMNIRVSINLSTLDLLNPELPNILSHHISMNKLDSSQLVLEITESAIMQDPVTTNQILNELKQQGYRISIDDFGTGYSSLVQLKTLPVNELKVDKSFVLNMKEGSDDAVIVKSTIELAHSMGLEVIAEGVETEDGEKLLKSFKCNKGQGYLYSRPLPAEDFKAWHQENINKHNPIKNVAA